MRIVVTNNICHHQTPAFIQWVQPVPWECASGGVKTQIPQSLSEPWHEEQEPQHGASHPAVSSQEGRGSARPGTLPVPEIFHLKGPERHPPASPALKFPWCFCWKLLFLPGLFLLFLPAIAAAESPAGGEIPPCHLPLAELRGTISGQNK